MKDDFSHLYIIDNPLKEGICEECKNFIPLGKRCKALPLVMVEGYAKCSQVKQCDHNYRRKYWAGGL